MWWLHAYIIQAIPVPVKEWKRSVFVQNIHNPYMIYRLRICMHFQMNYGKRGVYELGGYQQFYQTVMELWLLKMNYRLSLKLYHDLYYP